MKGKPPQDARLTAILREGILDWLADEPLPKRTSDSDLTPVERAYYLGAIAGEDGAFDAPITNDLVLMVRVNWLLQHPELLQATVTPRFALFWRTLASAFLERAKPRPPSQREIAEAVDALIDGKVLEPREARRALAKASHRTLKSIEIACQRYGRHKQQIPDCCTARLNSRVI